jgi:hypothetical protein
VAPGAVRYPLTCVDAHLSTAKRMWDLTKHLEG